MLDREGKRFYSECAMEKLKGIPASPGITIGKVFLFMDDALQIPQYDIHPEDLEGELQRFKDASKKATEELQDLKKKAETEISDGNSNFLESHLLMLEDEEFNEKINTNLKNYMKNVEWVLYKTMKEFVEKLNAAKDSYIRERAIDLHDVAKRVLNHLMYRVSFTLSDLAEEVVLVTHNLLPSDALQMHNGMIKGVAMDAGGKTSHTAILARSFEIPAVLGLSDISKKLSSGDEIIVDGNSGTVIIEPDEETRERYINTWKAWQKREVELLRMNQLPAETKDGKLIMLKANIEVPDEVDSVLSHGADGIGLFRSEFLFMNSAGLSTEDEQYEMYSRVLEEMDGKSVTIRTLDIGGDKTIPDLEGFDEENMLLGWRAVRFCLSRKDIFKTQLKALLRASIHGNLQIMFPLISGIEELQSVLEVLEETKTELSEENISFRNSIPLGIMVEVPSAALTSDILAKNVDFFSIGTNDLIQYTIAVDRGNEKIAYLYEPFHPGVLRLIKMIVENAHDQGIPVGLCGEMGGDPFSTVILLGLGLDELSMSSVGIPEIKKIIRSVSLSEAEELVGTIMDMRSYIEIDQFVKNWTYERFDFLSYK